MPKDKADESDRLLTSSISIDCPPPGTAVGATFTIAGSYNPSLRCPYRVECHVYYVDAAAASQHLEKTVVPHENPNEFKCKFTLTSIPSQGEMLLISARLFHSNGTPLSPAETSWLVYDSETTTDPCAGEKKTGAKKAK